jgi:thiol:disulfide interchange protein DsbA
MSKKILCFIAYTLFVCAISVGGTIGTFYYLFAFDNGQQSLVEMSSNEVVDSPLKDSDTMLEIISYGCHFCAINDKSVDALEKRLPKDKKIVRLHLTKKDTSGLSRFAPLFATLNVMGIEPKYRDVIYKSIIEDNINLTDDLVLKTWLIQNGIDAEEYQKIRHSQAVIDQLDYMLKVSNYYQVSGTPAFIINKKWVATQDRDFPDFADNLLSLYTDNKPLEK